MQSKAPTRKAAFAGQGLKRCWNCRSQKIACDKALPSCRNCTEKGRTCLGYGLKLSWPRDDDRRRFVRKKEHYLMAVQSKGLEFINVSAEDIEAAEKQVLAPYSQAVCDMLWFSHQPQKSIARLDPLLAITPHSPVARLISSSHSADDLYGLLIRLALTDDESPSLAARYAISALSYQHLRMETAAITHQGIAIRALQAAIEDCDPSRVMQMMAAGMLLSIFETLNFTLGFDAYGLSWSIFFCGTKKIASSVTRKHDTCFGDEALMMDWIFYHDVMYKFSIRHWASKNTDQVSLAAQTKVISKAVFSPERQAVVPTLGCSLELLDLLCHVIDSVLEPHDPIYQSPEHMKKMRSLEIRLRSLEQRHTGISGSDLEEVAHQTNIADLFRLAALTYLYRLAKREAGQSECVLWVLNRAFIVLGQVTYCERPWPLFVIALESRTEEQRAIVLTVLKASLQRQPLGSMALTSHMIHDAWKQQDLCSGEMDPSILYGLIISRNRVPPNLA
ncbi:fungal-specific transcription factor domain-containing protein [Ilyonectria sp. MPI-CAGE-AT-0026]|nr:fungal-specific transcription factor domain-containing protein [Ilyonectria sp. MPI-CAGE-AT-0026]